MHSVGGHVFGDVVGRLGLMPVLPPDGTNVDLLVGSEARSAASNRTFGPRSVPALAVLARESPPWDMRPPSLGAVDSAVKAHPGRPVAICGVQVDMTLLQHWLEGVPPF